MAYDLETQSRPVISKVAHEKLRELAQQERRTLQATLELLIEKAHRERVVIGHTVQDVKGSNE